MNFESFTPDEIEAMKSGTMISGRLHDDKPAVKVKQAPVNCDESSPASSGWGKAPRLDEMRDKVTHIHVRNEDGSVNPQQKVTRPNPDRYNQPAAARALKDSELREKAQKAEQSLSPTALHSTMQAMDRKIRKLEKQLKELQS